MTGSTPGAIDSPPRHPPALIEAERCYLVRWGRREVLWAGVATAAAAVAAGLAALHSALWLLLLVPVLPVGGLLILFFRNPPRRIPRGPGVLLAPADGRVIEVGEVHEPEYIGGSAVKVAIFLSIFDVHLNRSPASGRVEYLRHREGRHLDARDDRCARENESQAVGILRDDPGGPAGAKLLVRQISGAIARRIVAPLEEGQEVERGRLIGMIKYGSRTELYVAAPPGAASPEVLVRVGHKVKGGETALFRWR